MRYWLILATLWGFVGSTPLAWSAENGTLALPRFASLRSDQVNMRSGPGERYPIEWSYHRRDLPVEITAEFEAWRKIRDPNGGEGWVHQQMLTGRRMASVVVDKAKLYKTADDSGAMVAALQKGLIVKLAKCPKAMTLCKVEAGSAQGWVKRSEIWGIYPGEFIE